MNKQELLEEIVKLDIEVSENFPHYDLVDKEVVLALINQLDEPEQTDTNVGLSKPVIPKFVADWIEEKLPKGSIGTNTIEDKIYIISRFGYGNGLNTDALYQGRDYEFNNKLNRDLVKYVSNNKVKVIRALINGYEVEKEKKYYVAFEDINLLYVTRIEVYGENGKLNYNSESSTENAMKFIDKEKASSLAYFLGATVVEVTK